MTILTENSKISYTAPGGTPIFAYDFRVDYASDMHVYLDGVEQLTGWTMDGIGEPTGGSVTFDVNPAAGVIVVLNRISPITQEVDYQPYDPFPAETHEKALDKLTMILQQQQTADEGIIQINPGDPADLNLVLPPYQDLSFFRWSGNDLIYVGYADQAEAEAGTDDVKVMTAKTVLESIEVNAGAASYWVAEQNIDLSYDLLYDGNIDIRGQVIRSKAPITGFTGTVTVVDGVATFSSVLDAERAGYDPEDPKLGTIIETNMGFYPVVEWTNSTTAVLSEEINTTDSPITQALPPVFTWLDKDGNRLGYMTEFGSLVSRGGSSVGPGFAFGKGTSGFHSYSQKSIDITIEGEDRWQFYDNTFYGAEIGTAGLLNVWPTATLPSVRPAWDEVSGLGRKTLDHLTLIAGAVETADCYKSVDDLPVFEPKGSLALGEVLSGGFDLKYKGKTMMFDVHESSDIYAMPLYITGDGWASYADAAIEAQTPAVFLTLLNDDGVVEVMVEGQVFSPFASWSPGQTLYLDVAGGLTHTPPSTPGEFVQVLGWALSANTIYFRPEIGSIKQVT